MKKRLLSIMMALIAMIIPTNFWAQEPYAVLSQNNTVLTFYYDDQKAARNGMDVGPFYGSNIWYEQKESITNVVFDASFANCTTLTSTAFWFDGLKNLSTITGISNLKTNNVTSMYCMFRDCSNLTSLDVSNFKTDNVTNMDLLFYGCSSLTSLDVSNFKTDNVWNMGNMFNGCSSLTNLDVSNFKTDNVEDMHYMFSGCSGLTSLDLSNFKTNKVTHMYGMFRNCSGLTSLDLSNFNTTNVTDMSHMFNGCSSLTSLEVSNFKTDNVTNMGWMFEDCSGLTNLDLSNFKTDNVEGMNNMFEGCSGLTSISVTGFKTDKVTSMWSMFEGCSGLTNIDLSNFKTDNVEGMGYMFYGCSGLRSLDLSGFNTGNVTGMGGMFDDCSSLKTIYASSEWNTSKVENGESMFHNCTNLVGGAGTRYDANHIDYTYAHIDGGTANPGYFTAAGAEPWSGSESVIVSLINNGDMEGNDVSNYFVKIHAGDVVPATITNGVGVNESRGIKVEATAMEAEAWDNQFWVRLNQPVSDGTRFRVSYDYRADKAGRVQTESHEEPGTFIAMTYHGDSYDDRRYFSPEWQRFSYEGTMSFMNSSDQHPMQSVAFSLNHFEEANTYYFDNIVFEVIMEDQCPKPTFKRTDNNVTIQSPFDATIYFTVDGSTPTTDSQHFAGTVELSFSQDETWSATIKAIAVVEGYEASPVATYLYEPTDNNLDQRKEELMNKIYSLMQEVDVCRKELEMKDPDRTSYLWKDINDIEMQIDAVRERINKATTEEELDDCEDHILQIAYKLEELRKEIENYNPIHFSFDGLTAWVSGEATLDDAFAEVGGREEAAKTIAAIIWENTTALTADMLQGINNPNLLVYVNEARLAPQGVQNVVVNGIAQEIILTDATSGNNNFFCPQPFMAERISYTRNFRQQTEVGISRGWEGIALPFDVQTITHETKGTITPFGSGNGKHFWLRAYDGENMYSAREMEAYAPYVIAMPNSSAYYADYNLNGRVTFSATNTEVYETPDFSFLEDEPNMRLMTIPAFQTKAQSARVYAINVGQARGNHAEGSVFEQNLREVRPFEIYTVHNGQGTRPRFIPIKSQTNGEATGIVSIENGEWKMENGGWYSLDGRKLPYEPKTKGIYLHKGKKIRK